MKVSRFPNRLLFVLLIPTAVVAFGGVANARDRAYRTIYTFQGGNDGWTPIGVPAVDKNGDLYGATADGVAYNGGTIFKLTAPQTHSGRWTKTVLHNFPSGYEGYPVSVVLGEDQALYGFALGPQDCGFIWALTPPAVRGGVWKYAVLYTFNGSSDGCGPQGNPVFDAGGNLYGATEAGGDLCDNGHYTCGTVFELQRPTKGGKWHYKVLHTFTGKPDGATLRGRHV